jgi:hypothetical protein
MQVFPALAPKPIDMLIFDSRKLHPRMLLARSLLEHPQLLANQEHGIVNLSHNWNTLVTLAQKADY